MSRKAIFTIIAFIQCTLSCTPEMYAFSYTPDPGGNAEQIDNDQIR